MLDSVSEVSLTSRQPAPSPSAGASFAPRCVAGPAAGPRLRGRSSPLPPPRLSPPAPSPPATPGFAVSPERAPEGQNQRFRSQ